MARLLPPGYGLFFSVHSGAQLVGWGLVVLGAALYFWGLRHMVRAVKSGQLTTSGPFALVRHPMYSAWIVLLFPGITLASGGWLIVGSAVIAWLFFRRWVQAEEQGLLDLFGQPYEEYMARVPALIPFPPLKGESGL